MTHVFRPSFGCICALICIAWGGSQLSYGQTWFAEANLLPQDFRSSIPAAVSDIDGDRKDDLVILDQRRYLYVAFQRLWNQTYEVEFVSELDSANYWSVIAVDVDRNGLRDIVLASEFGDLETFYQKSGGWEHVRTPANDVFSQAMNAVDINEDGWIDLFVCNDVGYNAVFMNEAGTWKRDTSLFRDLDSTDAAGNYGSVWSDYDKDGDLDLYLAKCYAGAAPGDPRRINMLYENQNGSFIDVAQRRGLNTDDQSWTGDFEDFDNDGISECLVTNHDAPCSLYELVNDTFRDVSVERGFNFESTVMQNVNEDFDSDGWLDIFITGQSEILYHNQGKGQFAFTPNYFDTYYRINSGITGDLNYDGRPDIFATYGELITGPSSLNDKIWLNQLKENSYLDVYLSGGQSNPDAVGARLELYGSWGIQSREVKAGQSYGVQKSLTQRFGIGTEKQVDSLRIFWPNGSISVLYDLLPNNFVFAHESGFTYTPENSTPYQMFACQGDTLSIGTPDGIPVQWPDGDTSHYREFITPGFYQYSVRLDSQWISIPGQELILNYAPSKKVVFEDDCFCENDRIRLQSTDGSEVRWNTGELNERLVIDSSGMYFFKYTNVCGDSLFSDTVRIEEKPAPTIPGGNKNDTFPPADSLCISVEGELVRWYDTNGQLLEQNDTLKIWNFKRDTQFLVTNSSTYLQQRDTIGPSISGLTPTLNQVNRSLYFEVYKNTILHSVDVFAEVAGERLVEILDPRRNPIYSVVHDLDSGYNQVIIEFVIPAQPGLYRLTTNTMVNRSNFGVPAPKLLASAGLLDYPFEFNHHLSIFHSSFSTTDYHYFFNWDLEEMPLICESTFCTYTLTVDSTTGIEIPIAEFDVYPNPSAHKLIIGIQADAILVYSLDGRMVKSEYYAKEIIISDLQPATYIIEIKKDGQMIRKLWVKN